MYNNSAIMRIADPGHGVVGGFFKFSGSEDVFGISNNHVIANFNQCNVGDVITDAGTQAAIGSLVYWVTLEQAGTGINTLDVALFKFTDPHDLDWRVNSPLISKPNGFINPIQGGHVYMIVGSQIRKGYISNPRIGFVQDFAMGNNTYSFENLIEIVSMDGQPFSTPGNSGSVIISEDNHCIVGLLIGTNNARDRSYAAPFIGGILNTFSLMVF